MGNGNTLSTTIIDPPEDEMKEQASKGLQISALENEAQVNLQKDNDEKDQNKQKQKKQLSQEPLMDLLRASLQQQFGFVGEPKEVDNPEGGKDLAVCLRAGPTSAADGFARVIMNDFSRGYLTTNCIVKVDKNGTQISIGEGWDDRTIEAALKAANQKWDTITIDKDTHPKLREAIVRVADRLDIKIDPQSIDTELGNTPRPNGP